FRGILPNVPPAMGYIAIPGITLAIVAEGRPAHLGASVEPPPPSWGVVLHHGKPHRGETPFLEFNPLVATRPTLLCLHSPRRHPRRQRRPSQPELGRDDQRRQAPHGGSPFPDVHPHRGHVPHRDVAQLPRRPAAQPLRRP